MPLDKLLAFTKDVGDLANKPNATMTAEQLKAQFDAAPNELRLAFNQLIDDFQSVVDGDSGADNIAVTTIAGLTGATVQAILESLKALDDDNRAYLIEQINGVTLGQVPDGSITPVKLSADAKKASNIDVEDVNSHFTANKLDGVLAELFQFADSVHQDWTYVIGLPLLKADTSAQKKSKTQTIKNDLATNLTAKGQTSVGTETLDALIDKVPLISTGKKFASGTISYISGNLVISGLTFRPSKVVLYGDSPLSTSYKYQVVTVNFSKLIPHTSIPSNNTISAYDNGSVGIALSTASVQNADGVTVPSAVLFPNKTFYYEANE